MFAMNLKALAVSATIFAALSPSVHACLELSGWADSGFTTGGSITAVDNGVQTCSGSIESGDNNLDCIPGFALNYDYTDNPTMGPIPITYCNPTACYSIDIPITCSISNNCCGGQIPCQCYTCTFDYTTFC